MLDAYQQKHCSRQDRKSQLESALSEKLGRPVTIDFTINQDASLAAPAPPPRMTRAQQIRELQDDDFVKEAVSIFEGEIAGFRHPAK